MKLFSLLRGPVEVGVVRCLWTPVSVLGRSDKVIFTVVEFVQAWMFQYQK